MKRWMLVACLGSLFIASAAPRAEPDRNIRYLMNEPATMFDIGMLRLERWLESREYLMNDRLEETEVVFGLPKLIYRVGYDRSENNIDVFVHVRLPIVEAHTWTEQECRAVLAAARSASLLGPSTMMNIFSPRSSVTVPDPEEFFGGVSSRIMFRTQFRNGFNCQGRLPDDLGIGDIKLLFDR